MGEIFTIVERLSSGHTIFYCHRLPFETEVIQFIWHYKLHAVWDGHILSVIVNLLVQFPIWKPIEYFLCITIKYTHSTVFIVLIYNIWNNKWWQMPPAKRRIQQKTGKLAKKLFFVLLLNYLQKIEHTNIVRRREQLNIHSCERNKSSI